MMDARFNITMCDPNFPCKAVAMLKPVNAMSGAQRLFLYEKQFAEVAEWCVEFLGSNTPLERWVTNHKERRVYFYNLDDATLFKLRWC